MDVQELPFERLVQIYLPRLVQEHIRSHFQITSSTDDFYGAVVFLDVKGFTRLTGVLAAYPNGAELISTTINDYFTALLKHLDADGDLVNFDGDALILGWFTTLKDEMQLMLLKAAHFCQALMTDADVMDFRATTPDGEDIHLTYHAGVGVGDCKWMTVGCNNMFRYTLAGEAMHQSAVLCSLSKQGQFAISLAAHQLLEDRCTVSTLVGEGDEQGWVVEAFYVPSNLARKSRNRVPRSPPKSSPRPPVAEGLQDDLEFLNDLEEPNDGLRAVTPLLMPPRASFRIRNEKKHSMVLGPLSFNMKAANFMFDLIHRSQAECQGQIRNVNTLFIKLRSEARCLSPSEVSELHQVFHVLFSELARFDGVCNKVVMDDKGLVVLCIFGLPYHSYEDDTARALEFAWAAAEQVERVTGRIGVGITRQKVYCGNVGGEQRKEYSVLGNGVNLAARLMTLAAASTRLQSTILCSSEVHREVKNNGKFVFDEPQKHQLKGLEQPIKVYSVLHVLMDSASASTRKRSLSSSVTSSLVQIRNANYHRRVSDGGTSHRSSVSSVSVPGLRRSVSAFPNFETLPFSVSEQIEDDAGTVATDEGDRAADVPPQLVDSVSRTSDIICQAPAQGLSDSICASPTFHGADGKVTVPMTQRSADASPREPTPAVEGSVSTTPAKAGPIEVAADPHSKPATVGVLKAMEGRATEMSVIRRIVEGVASNTPGSPKAGWARQASSSSSPLRRERIRSRLLVIHGEAGIGKSLLLGHAAQLAMNMQVDWVFTCGDIREAATSLYGFKLLLADVMSIYAAREQEWVSKVPPQYRMWLPWLHAVAPESVPQRLICSVVGNMAAPAETPASLPLLFKFAQELLAVRFSSSGGLLIFVDDAQWIDNATFEFLSELMITNSSISMVIGMRQTQARSGSARRYSSSSSGSAKSIVRRASSSLGIKPSKDSFFENEHLTRVTMKQQINLDALSASETARHVCTVLRVKSIDPALVSIIFRSSNGNPGFVEQFIRRLQEKDAIASDGFEAYLKPSYTSDKIELPSGVESLVLSRLDSLGTKQSSLLKMACVIGPTFTVPLLANCLGDHVGDCLIRLEELIAANFLQILTNEDDNDRPADACKPLQYTFKRSAFAVVLYDTMLFSERKQRHEKVLSVLEESAVKDYPLLAHHCNALGLPKGLEYYDVAAENAWEAKAFMTCIKLITELQAFQAQHRLKVLPATSARWEFLLAASKHRAGDVQGSIKHVEKCLQLLGFSLPSALSLLKQRLRHCFGCWAPPVDPLAPGAAPTSPVDMHCELMVMRAEYCLATQDKDGLQLAAVTALNLSRARSIPIQALTRSMAVLAKLVLVSTAQAKRHYRKAKALLVIGNHPIKTHQLVAWYHLLSRDSESLSMSLKEADRQAAGKDAVGLLGMSIVSILDKALSGELADAMRECDEGLRLAREAQSPHYRELLVLRSLLLIHWVGDPGALEEQSAMLAALRKRCRATLPGDGAAPPDPLGAVLLDALLPALMWYAASQKKAPEAIPKSVALLTSDFDFWRCATIPTLYHALAVSMLLEVLLCPGDAASPASVHRDAVQAALRSLEKAADLLPVARPLHLLWGGRWQQVQGQAASAATTLRAAALRAEQLRMPHTMLTATYLRKAEEPASHGDLKEIQRKFEAMGAMHRQLQVGRLLHS